MSENTGCQTLDEKERFKIECDIRNIKNNMFTAKCCFAAEDPADLDLIRPELNRYYFSKDTKKDISGSPEFQHAMYVIDKIKAESISKNMGKARIALEALSENLKESAFDDPKWRKSKYEAEYAELACTKRELELELENQEDAEDDPAYKKLQDEHAQLVKKHEQAFENFVQKNSRLPEAKEYLAFKAELNALGVIIDE